MQARFRIEPTIRVLQHWLSMPTHHELCCRCHTGHGIQHDCLNRCEVRMHQEPFLPAASGKDLARARRRSMYYACVDVPRRCGDYIVKAAGREGSLPSTMVTAMPTLPTRGCSAASRMRSTKGIKRPG